MDLTTVQGDLNLIRKLADRVERYVETTEYSHPLPDFYRSASKGHVRISDMHTLHILRAARKTTDPSTYRAFCQEIGERFIRGEE